jgi:hypothetical protein
LLSTGGRLVLVNSVLSSLSMYMMSFFRIHKGVLQRLDYYRSRFFGNVMSTKRKRNTYWLGGVYSINLEILEG